MSNVTEVRQRLLGHFTSSTSVPVDADGNDSVGAGALLMKDDGAQPLLCVSDNLVGDYLDKDELIYAVFGRGEAADRAASERVEQLGGRKLIEE